MSQTPTSCPARSGRASFALGAGRAALATCWYAVVVAPDGQTALHRALRTPTGAWRFGEAVRGALQLATLPVACLLAALGRAHLARPAVAAVLANPPTVLLASLLAHDVGAALLAALHSLWTNATKGLIRPKAEAEQIEQAVPVSA